MVKEFEIDVRKIIDAIGEVTKIATIRDLIFSPKTFIVNIGFEQDQLGWLFASEDVSIVTDVMRYGAKSVKFEANSVAWIEQYFPIPWNTDWLKHFFYYVLATATGQVLTMYMWDIDGTRYDYSPVQNAVGVWEKKEYSLPSNKYIERLQFYKNAYGGTAYLDDVTMVF